MNRYLYGATKGLSLDSIAKPVWAPAKFIGGLPWLQNSSARIVSGELLLCLTHTIEGGTAILRDSIDKGRHLICTHVATAPFQHTWTLDGRYMVPDVMTHRILE